MEYTKFIRLVKKQCNKSAWKYGGMSEFKRKFEPISWMHFKLIKLGTERINYHCDFENKVCKKFQQITDHGKAKMCCCTDCFFNVGYLHIFQLENEPETRIFAKKFIEPKNSQKLQNSGFWRVNGGCALPRMYRSTTCLEHHCNPSKMSKLDLFYIKHILSFYNYDIIQSRLIPFVEKELNNKKLVVNRLSAAKKEHLINIIWKFAEQEFNIYN